MLAFIILMTVSFLGAAWFVIYLSKPGQSETVSRTGSKSGPLRPSGRLFEPAYAAQAEERDTAFSRSDKPELATVSSRPDSGEEAGSTGRPPVILIVDDQKAIRDMLLSLFAAEGFEAHGAENGQAALRQTAALRADYVLLDLDLPDLSGIEVLRRMRRAGCHAKVVLISAFVDPGILPEAERLGMMDQFAKPFDVKELRGRILADWKLTVRGGESIEGLDLG